MSGEHNSERKGPIARKGAIFFCVAALTFALCGLLFGVACSHTSANTEKEVIATGSATDTEVTPSESPKETPVQREPDKKPSIEALKTELDHAQFENMLLKEENDWLRSEVIGLHQELAEATQTIYSLNRKLDAIFKPNNTAE